MAREERPMQGLLARLDRWLAKHRPRFHRNLQPGASATELALLQNSLKNTVPRELTDWLAWHDGQGDDFVGFFESHWLLMSVEQIVQAKAELDHADIEGWNPAWLPFLDDDGGNFICLDSNTPKPSVVVFCMGAPPETVAASLESWLCRLVTAVEAGEYHEDSERGTFERRQHPQPGQDQSAS